MRYLLDANVVLRVLLADDPRQSPEARKLFVWAETRMGVLHLSAATLAEIGWVLRSYYKFDRVAIARQLRGVLLHPGIHADAHLLQAVDFYEQLAVDFLDCVLAAEAMVGNDLGVVSFDRDYRRFSGLKWFTPGQIAP